VRRARVEDHDDLVAVLGAAGGRYPSLAALPDSAAGEEPYALTGLIGQQDGRNVVLVAEERGRVVGVGCVGCVGETGAAGVSMFGWCRVVGGGGGWWGEKWGSRVAWSGAGGEGCQQGLKG
jgi:hypothetical protein